MQIDKDNKMSEYKKEEYLLEIENDNLIRKINEG